MVMPDSTGPETAKRIQATRQSLRLIYMSGYSEYSMADRGFLDPGITFLQKPFSPETLVTKVRTVLAQQNPKGIIVVAEEDAGVRALFRKRLSHAGYEVTEADNGVDVAEHLRASRVDIVIFDFAMAKRTGLNPADILSNRPELSIIGTFTQPSELAYAANFNVVASFANPLESMNR